MYIANGVPTGKAACIHLRAPRWLTLIQPVYQTGYTCIILIHPLYNFTTAN